MIAVERLDSLSHCVQEAPSERKIDNTLPNWPQQGRIEFRNVYMRYRDSTDVVLHDI
jgi:ABC-type bacteriocin/lantibiotic exporter with double-glycine peptidase domain